MTRAEIRNQVDARPAGRVLKTASPKETQGSNGRDGRSKANGTGPGTMVPSIPFERMIIELARQNA